MPRSHSGKAVRRATFAGVSLAFALAACAQAPLTGRNQLILVPESQDADMGLQAYQQIKQRSRSRAMPRSTSGSRPWADGSPKSAVNPTDRSSPWFENPEPNAFALPGGKVGVNTGLFKVAKNDAQATR